MKKKTKIKSKTTTTTTTYSKQKTKKPKTKKPKKKNQKQNQKQNKKTKTRKKTQNKTARPVGEKKDYWVTKKKYFMKITPAYGFIWNDNNIKCLHTIFTLRECTHVCILIVS